MAQLREDAIGVGGPQRRGVGDAGAKVTTSVVSAGTDTAAVRSPQLAAAELTRGSVRGGQAFVEVGVGYVAGPVRGMPNASASPSVGVAARLGGVGFR
jgi:hypothetical protein